MTRFDYFHDGPFVLQYMKEKCNSEEASLSEKKNNTINSHDGGGNQQRSQINTGKSIDRDTIHHHIRYGYNNYQSSVRVSYFSIFFILAFQLGIIFANTICNL